MTISHSWAGHLGKEWDMTARWKAAKQFIWKGCVLLYCSTKVLPQAALVCMQTMFKERHRRCCSLNITSLLWMWRPPVPVLNCEINSDLWSRIPSYHGCNNALWVVIIISQPLNCSILWYFNIIRSSNLICFRKKTTLLKIHMNDFCY